MVFPSTGGSADIITARQAGSGEVLLVSNRPASRDRLGAALRSGLRTVSVRWEPDPGAARGVLTQVDCLVLEHDSRAAPLPDLYIQLLMECGDALPPTVVLTRVGEEAIALASLRAGAVAHLDLEIDSDTQIVQCIVAALECSSAHQQRREQTASLNMLAAAVVASVDAVVITSAELEPPGPRILFVNPAFERLTGYTAAEVLGRTPRLLQGPRTDRAVLDELKRKLRAGRPFHGETYNYRKDGEEFLLEWWVAPVKDSAGRVQCYAATQRDVTASRQEHVEALHHLRESESHLHSAQVVGQIGSFDWDLTSDRARVSPNWEVIHGLPPGSFSGGSEQWARLVHPEDHARVLGLFADATHQQRGELREEHRIVQPDGSVRWLEGRTAYFYDARGQAVRAVGVVIDTTDRKDWELELEARVAERTRALSDAARLLADEMKRREEVQATLIQAQKLEALGQLTGGVAHDFNNLLMAIQGSLQLIERRVGDERILRHVSNARDAARRAERLTGQLLAFARRQELAPATVSISELFESVDALLRQAVTSRVQLAIGIDASTWPALVDPHQLEMALLNLAVNARDAMPEGGTITLTSRNLPTDDPDKPRDLPRGDFVVVSVADTGMGMTPEVQARVLEPFFTTKELGRGTGLGLPMVHGFTKQSGGDLRIQSRPGSGTTIELFLPRSSELVVVAPDESAEIDRARHGNATILVVDDDEQVRPVAASLLRDLGYTVLEAADAETAFALAYAVEHLDLVVTDVVMPGADGTALASRLRSAWPTLPILFITGHPRGATLNDERVLSKPFTLVDLAAQTLTLLGRDRPAELDLQGLAEATFASDRVYARIKSANLRHLYRLWHEYRMDGAIPPFSRFSLVHVTSPECTFVAAVEGPASEPTGFRFLSVGTALTERLGRPLAGELVQAAAGDDMLGALEASYRRCCRSGAPTHEYARFNLGDGHPLLFERLLVPLSDDGQTVTHLVGMVMLTEL